jgi:hypothetical protein
VFCRFWVFWVVWEGTEKGGWHRTQKVGGTNLGTNLGVWVLCRFWVFWVVGEGTEKSGWHRSQKVGGTNLDLANLSPAPISEFGCFVDAECFGWLGKALRKVGGTELRRWMAPIGEKDLKVGGGWGW